MGALEIVHSGAGSVEVAGTLETGGMAIGYAGTGWPVGAGQNEAVSDRWED